jgi:eukaryotic-like serine/threonine-protein kinase
MSGIGIGVPGGMSQVPYNNPLLGAGGQSIPGLAQPPGRVITASGSPGVVTAGPASTPVPAKSGGGRLVMVLLVLALIGAGGGFAWQQGYFGPATDIAGTDPAPAPESADPASTPSSAGNPAPDAPATRESFLAGFGDDACSYASRVEAGALAGMVEGYATKEGAFAGLPEQYETAFGSRPDVKDRVVNDAQCPVLTAARAVQALGAPAPTVTLDSDALAPGGFVVGQIRERRGRPTWMALITPDGRVFNLTSQLTNQPDGSATFSFGLAATTATTPQPHLIVVIASDDPLTTAIAQDGKLSGDLMPLIQAEIEGRGGKAGVGLAWFAQNP